MTMRGCGRESQSRDWSSSSAVMSTYNAHFTFMRKVLLTSWFLYVFTVAGN
jgi:hypothetical protein